MIWRAKVHIFPTFWPPKNSQNDDAQNKFSKKFQIALATVQSTKVLKSPQQFLTSFSRWQTSSTTRRGMPNTFFTSRVTFGLFCVRFAPRLFNIAQLEAGLSHVTFTRTIPVSFRQEITGLRRFALSEKLKDRVMNRQHRGGQKGEQRGTGAYTGFFPGGVRFNKISFHA